MDKDDLLKKRAAIMATAVPQFKTDFFIKRLLMPISHMPPGGTYPPGRHAAPQLFAFWSVTLILSIFTG
ncbi:hypothetical protein, partial [Thalassolituus sp. UBA1505]|uniref:hypothetical protein n=1 Tax=Thalassolituus sp. UBA1505 TaxID=1947653 RepID=UPI0025CD2694